MEKLLLKFDESNYESEKAIVDSYLPEIQDVINAFNSMDIGKLSKSDFERIFTATDELVYDKMTVGKTMEFGGLPIEKSKAIHIIQKPVGYEKLIDAIEVTVNVLKGFNSDNQLHNIKCTSANQINSVYELDNNGLVIVKSVVYESLKKQNEKYATSSIAIKLNELATIVAEKCKDPEILSVINSNGDGLSKIVRSILNDHSDGSYTGVSVDIPGILKYNQPGFRY